MSLDATLINQHRFLTICHFSLLCPSGLSRCVLYGTLTYTASASTPNNFCQD